MCNTVDPPQPSSWDHSADYDRLDDDPRGADGVYDRRTPDTVSSPQAPRADTRPSPSLNVAAKFLPAIVRNRLWVLFLRQRERVRFLRRINVTDVQRLEQLQTSLGQLEVLRSSTTDDDRPASSPRQYSDVLHAPVFLFSAGWRSGSTLLARLLSTPKQRLIWGEPYHYSDVLLIARRIIESITDDWPPEDFLVSTYSDSLDDLSHAWIANVFPTPDALVRALQEFYLCLFADPAVELGFESWGVKEVHVNGRDALALSYIFPCARFIFLVREPTDAWQSYRGTGSLWRFTDRGAPIGGPVRFGRMWSRMATSFIDTPLSNSIVVRYEDLNSTQELDRIEAFLGSRIDRSAIDRRIGSSQLGRSQTYGNARVRMVTRRSRRRLGYH